MSYKDQKEWSPDTRVGVNVEDEMEFKAPTWLPDPMSRVLSMARPMTSWAARSHHLGQVPGFPDVSFCKRVGALHTVS